MGKASWGQLFNAHVVAPWAFHVFAQFNRINAILYYLPENPTRAGFTIERALLYSDAFALIYYPKDTLHG